MYASTNVKFAHTEIVHSYGFFNRESTKEVLTLDSVEHLAATDQSLSHFVNPAYSLVA